MEKIGCCYYFFFFVVFANILIFIEKHDSQTFNLFTPAPDQFELVTNNEFIENVSTLF